MPSYTAGWNQPGCLPEMMPVEFDNKVDAVQYLVEAVETEWASAEDPENLRSSTVITECMSAHTELHNDPSIPFVAYIDGYNYWIEHTEEGSDGQASPRDLEYHDEPGSGTSREYREWIGRAGL